MNDISVFKVLFVLGSASNAGTEKQTIRLAMELKARGVEVFVVLLTSGGPLLEILESNDIPYLILGIRIRKFQPFKNIRGIRKYVQVLKQNRPDIIQSQLIESVIFNNFMQVFIRTPIVNLAGIRGEIPYKNRLVELVIKLLLRKSEGVIVNATHLEFEVQNRFGIPNSNIHKLRNGVDFQVQSADVSKSPPTAVVIANFLPYKGYPELFAALKDIDTQISVKICGVGPRYYEYQELCRSYEIENIVTFLQQPIDLQQVLQESQFAIHPSKTEGLSNAVLEELSFGLPIIALDIPGNLELIRDGVNGYKVEVGAIEKMRESIKNMSSDPDLRLRMGRESKQLVQGYSWENTVDTYVAICLHVLHMRV